MMLSAAPATAQLLAERLVPPQQFPIPDLPQAVPQARLPSGPERLSAHLWSLPVGTLAGSPTGLTAERAVGVWSRPALDVPTLAAEPDPRLPQVTRLPTGPKSLAASGDPNRPPALDPLPRIPESPSRPGDDPSAPSAYRLITATVPLAPPNSAPALRLSIPDPYEQVSVIRLSQLPTDNDAPAASLERPPLPKLPEAAPAK